MSQLDTYRKTMLRKTEEIAKLNEDLAKEQAKIAPLQKKIISAKTAITRTKNSATVKSKMNEIDRANKSISDIQKKCGDIYKKIAQKEKEHATAEKNYRNEEAKQNKKDLEAEKKRQKNAERQAAAIQRSLIEYGNTQNRIQMEIEKLKSVPERITVLFLAANPIDTPKLSLDEEARSIYEKIRLSEYRDSIKFESRWATRSSNILQAINETNPTIVHFSGHGAQTGDLALLNSDGTTKIVSKEAITMAMSTASDTIRLVVFNACFSEEQAANVVKHIEAAIGMSDSIRDDTARVFAAQLYSSIGFGKSLQVAFNQAKAELLLENIPGEDIPQLYARDGVELDDMILVCPETE